MEDPKDLPGSEGLLRRLTARLVEKSLEAAGVEPAKGSARKPADSVDSGQERGASGVQPVPRRASRRRK